MSLTKATVSLFPSASATATCLPGQYMASDKSCKCKSHFTNNSGVLHKLIRCSCFNRMPLRLCPC